MVARARRIRTHCSTCGHQLPAGGTWAYCSKACETGRRGLDPADADNGEDRWLVRIHDERLRLMVDLEHSAPGDRARLVAEIMANHAREAAVRAEIETLKHYVTTPCNRCGKPTLWVTVAGGAKVQLDPGHTVYERASDGEGQGVWLPIVGDVILARHACQGRGGN